MFETVIVFPTKSRDTHDQVNKAVDTEEVRTGDLSLRFTDTMDRLAKDAPSVIAGSVRSVVIFRIHNPGFSSLFSLLPPFSSLGLLPVVSVRIDINRDISHKQNYTY